MLGYIIGFLELLYQAGIYVFNVKSDTTGNEVHELLRATIQDP